MPSLCSLPTMKLRRQAWRSPSFPSPFPLRFGLRVCSFLSSFPSPYLFGSQVAATVVLVLDAVQRRREASVSSPPSTPPPHSIGRAKGADLPRQISVEPEHRGEQERPHHF